MNKKDLKEKVSEKFSWDINDEELDELLEAVDAYSRIWQSLMLFNERNSNVFAQYMKSKMEEEDNGN